MPWKVEEQDGKFCVVKKGDGSTVKCHADRASATKHMRALYANEPNMYSVMRFDEAVIELTEDPNEMWVQAYRFGHWDHPVYGDVAVDTNVAEEMVQNFRSGVYGDALSYGYEHGLDRAKGSKASGTVIDMEVRDDGVYDKVRFTEPALAEIKAGEWKYISPEHKEVWTDPETGEVHYNVRVGGTLTNDGFFKGMAPLNFSELSAKETDRSAIAEKLGGTNEETPIESDDSKEGGVVDDLTKKFAAVFGVELTEDMDEDAVLAQATELNKIIEPLRNAKEDGEKTQTFREMFPDEYAEHIRLKEDKVERDALSFSEQYSRFTVKDGDEEKKSPYGFSQKVKDKIAEVHRKFSNREISKEDLKALLDAIGDNGIVDYSERGSARLEDDEEYTPADPTLAFSAKITELMDTDSLDYEAAMNMARSKFPELYEGYKRAVPVIRGT
jgi:hypothetical protein